MDGAWFTGGPRPQGLWRATRLAASRRRRRRQGTTPLARRLMAGRAVSAVAVDRRPTVIAPAYSRTREQSRRLAAGAIRSGRGGAPTAWRRSPGAALGQRAALAVSRRRLAARVGRRRRIRVSCGICVRRRADVRVLTRTQAWSLAFDADGDRLAIGGDVAADTGRASVEVWNVADVRGARRIARFESNGVVAACGLSPDGDTVAWTVGARAFVRPVARRRRAGAAGRRRAAAQGGVSRRTSRITTSASPRAASAGGRVAITSRVRHRHAATRSRQSAATRRWLPEDWLSNGWTVREEGQRSGRCAPFGSTRAAPDVRGAADRGAPRPIESVVLDSEPQGRRRADCGADRHERRRHLSLSDQPPKARRPIVRQLRGHTADITSLAVSLDLRYLASASLDGTVCVWPLAEVCSRRSARAAVGQFVRRAGRRAGRRRDSRPTGPRTFAACETATG